MEIRASDSLTYSFVVPIGNEEQALPELGRRLAAVLDRLEAPGEVVLVDDGSEDRSLQLMKGHQIATAAGLHVASGAAVVVIDGDLQGPPEVTRR